MRGLTIDLCTVTKINNMAMKGPGTQGTWKLIELSEKKNDINIILAESLKTGRRRNKHCVPKNPQQINIIEVHTKYIPDR